MDDEDSQSDLAKKRTARVQLANGAMEARAYVAPTPVPLDSDHKTIEMRTVAVDESLDPRRKATVARGMGEALPSIEGDIIDPTTGRVLPPVDIKAVPDTPWAQGKRPTQMKGGVPIPFGAPTAGRAADGTGAGYGTYIAAGALVAVAIACALVLVSARTPKTGADVEAPSAASARTSDAERSSVSAGAAAPLAAPASAALAPPTAFPPTVASSSGAATDPGPPRIGPPVRGSAAPSGGKPSGKPTHSKPPPSGDRIF